MQAAPTPYPELNQVLAELVSGIQRILEHDFIGAYLQGSFALGDFDRDRKSTRLNSSHYS